jgi:hypothetical protein
MNELEQLCRSIDMYCRSIKPSAPGAQQPDISGVVAVSTLLAVTFSENIGIFVSI